MVEIGSTQSGLVEQVAAWLLTYAIHGTVLLGAAWLATRSRRIGAHAEETLWKLALIGALLTSTVAQFRPGAAAVRLPSPQAMMASTPTPAAVPSISPSGDVPAADVAIVDARSATRGVRWTEVIVAVWLAGAVIALARLGAGWARFARRLARVPVSSGDPAQAALDEIRGSAGVRRRIRLTASGSLGAPVALGFREICVPRDVAVRLDGEQLRAMLAHETAHLLRGDPAWLWLGSVTAGVFWFQPLLRVCLRGMRRAAEYRCDQWAAGRAGAFALARCLAEVATWPQARIAALPAAAMAGEGAHLVDRVERLLHGGPEPRGHRRWTAAAVLALATAAAYVPTVSAGSAGAQARQQSYAERFRITAAMADAVERAAAAEGVDAELAFRLVHTESRFDERKLGPGGVGLTQIILPTARRLQPGITRRELLRRDTNLRLGLRYLHRMLVRYDGNVTRAVQAYYQGPTGLERDGATAGTRAYAGQLLGSVAGLPAYRGPGLRPPSSSGVAR